jgi:hypothetical protein
MLRIVEKALLDGQIPGVIPQVANDTTIRIPIAKYVYITLRNLRYNGRIPHAYKSARPTLESRQAFTKEMSKLAEASKIQVRAAREAVLKAVRGAQKTPLDKNSSEVKKVRDAYASRSKGAALMPSCNFSFKSSLTDT